MYCTLSADGEQTKPVYIVNTDRRYDEMIDWIEMLGLRDDSLRVVNSKEDLIAALRSETEVT